MSFVSFDLSEKRVIHSITYWVMGPFFANDGLLLLLSSMTGFAPKCRRTAIIYTAMDDEDITCENVFSKTHFYHGRIFYFI